jgi:hypothetical protein
MALRKSTSHPAAHTTRPTLAFIAVLVAASISGCFQYAYGDSDAAAPHIAFAKEFFDLLRTGNLDVARSRINPAAVKPELQRSLQDASRLFPHQEPRDVKTIVDFVNVHCENGPVGGTTDTWRANVTLQYEFAGVWLLASATVSKNADAMLIDGVEVERIAGPLDKINSFSFERKSTFQYAFLAAVCAMPIFIVAALVICFRTPLPKHKWLWSIFIAFGVGQIALNWTTGRIDVSLLNVQLLGAGFVKPSAYTPVYLLLSLPLGAIVFLARRWRWLSRHAGSDDKVRPPQAGEADAAH